MDEFRSLLSGDLNHKNPEKVLVHTKEFVWIHKTLSSQGTAWQEDRF